MPLVYFGIRLIYSIIAVFLNFITILYSKNNARLIIKPSFIINEFELEGLKPFLIYRTEFTNLINLKNKLNYIFNKLPFYSPLCTTSKEEFQNILKYVYGNEIFIRLKILQKLNRIAKLPQTKKTTQSINKIAKQFDINLKDGNISLIINKYEELARLYLPSSQLPKTEGTFYNNFFDEKIDISQKNNSSLFSSDAMKFWIIISSGNISPAIKNNPNQKLQQIIKANIKAEYLLQMAQYNRIQKISPWIKQSFLKTIENKIEEKTNRKSNTPFCNRPFQQLGVTCEGDLSLCCWASEPRHFVGNILENNIDEVWNSPLMSEIRNDIIQGQMPMLCSSVDGCPYKHTENLPSEITPKAEIRFIDIQLSNAHCNIGGIKPTKENPACIMCERDMPGYIFQDDSKFNEVLEKIKPLMGQLHTLHIQGVSEPFWKNIIFEVLETLEFSKYKNQIKVSTVTNGIPFTKKNQIKILEMCPHLSIALSLDASTPETYQKIRRLDVFNSILENAKHFSRIRRAYKWNYFQIQNNINLLNLHEVKAMVQMAKDLNVDRLELNPTGGHYRKILVNFSNKHLFQEAEKIAREEASKIGLNLAILRPLDADV